MHFMYQDRLTIVTLDFKQTETSVIFDSVIEILLWDKYLFLKLIESCDAYSISHSKINQFEGNQIWHDEQV
jgi:hypothetical protein